MPQHYNDDKKKNGGRVHKDKADKALQSKMEGKNTDFQGTLRAAEAKGGGYFMYKGKVKAAANKERPFPSKRPISVMKTTPRPKLKITRTPVKKETPPKTRRIKVGTYKPKFPKGRKKGTAGPYKG